MTCPHHGTAGGEPEAKPIPRERTTPFDPPPELAELRDRAPIAPLRFPDGHVGWLVTNHALGRTVLSDPRFSSHNTLRRPVIKLPVADDQGLRPMIPGAFVAMDPPEHTRFRRPLTPHFTVRRVRTLEPMIEKIVQEQLDDLERSGAPADLIEHWAIPIPALVICAMLGVPPSSREEFRRDATALIRLDIPPAEAAAARQALLDNLGALVREKRASPCDDILSELAAAGDLSDEEIAGVGFLLLFAGHEITASMFALGAFRLLSEPPLVDRLRDDPELLPGALEELLRYLTVVQYGTVRGATEDLELGGVLVAKGQSVCVSWAAANRDPERFPDPDVLDLDRDAESHLAFGHGVHHCIGEQLARAELRIGLAALLERLPGLRLAVDPGEVPLRTETIIYGVDALPVTWDG